MLLFQGYTVGSCGTWSRIKKNWDILRQNCEKIKTVLQKADAMCPQEKADFLQMAEECITYLEDRKYSVLIAGKTFDSN